MSFGKTNRFLPPRTTSRRFPTNPIHSQTKSPSTSTTTTLPPPYNKNDYLSFEPDEDKLSILLDRHQIDTLHNRVTRQIGITNNLYDHDIELSVTTTRSNYLFINGKRAMFKYLSPRETVWIDIQFINIDGLLQEIKYKYSQGKKPCLIQNINVSATYIKTKLNTIETPPLVVERKITIRLMSGSPKKETRNQLNHHSTSLNNPPSPYAHNSTSLQHYQEQASSSKNKEQHTRQKKMSLKHYEEQALSPKNKEQHTRQWKNDLGNLLYRTRQKNQKNQKNQRDRRTIDDINDEEDHVPLPPPPTPPPLFNSNVPPSSPSSPPPPHSQVIHDVQKAVLKDVPSTLMLSTLPPLPPPAIQENEKEEETIAVTAVTPVEQVEELNNTNGDDNLSTPKRRFSLTSTKRISPLDLLISPISPTKNCHTMIHFPTETRKTRKERLRGNGGHGRKRSQLPPGVTARMLDNYANPKTLLLKHSVHARSNTIM